MSVTTSAGGIIFNSNNQIALVTDEDNIWMFPKGHQETGETLLKTAKREIYEECGIKDLELIYEIDMYKRFSMKDDGSEDKSKLKKIKMYVFTTMQKELKPHADDIMCAGWFDIKDAAEKLTHPKDREILKLAVKIHKK